jgi:hypothetical protein
LFKDVRGLKTIKEKLEHYNAQQVCCFILSCLWRVRFGGHIASMRNITNAYKISVGKPQGKRPI